MRIVYSHGFASSPRSRKAVYFGERFRARGVEFITPELDGGDFHALTLSGQIDILRGAVGDTPAVLMGSSLGGYLSAWFAAHQPHLVEKTILLAPAFHFTRRWRERMTPAQLSDWEATDKLSVFHYGAGGQRDLGYGFLRDALNYESAPDFPQPALIFHGTADEVVPPAFSEDFAAHHPNVQLRLLASGHELTDMLEPIWRETERFLFQKP
jgi:pimeloyl-ACP methyl ester carboxylesterase